MTVHPLWIKALWLNARPFMHDVPNLVISAHLLLISRLPNIALARIVGFPVIPLPDPREKAVKK